MVTKSETRIQKFRNDDGGLSLLLQAKLVFRILWQYTSYNWKLPPLGLPGIYLDDSMISGGVAEEPLDHLSWASILLTFLSLLGVGNMKQKFQKYSENTIIFSILSILCPSALTSKPQKPKNSTKQKGNKKPRKNKKTRYFQTLAGDPGVSSQTPKPWCGLK